MPIRHRINGVLVVWQHSTLLICACFTTLLSVVATTVGDELLSLRSLRDQIGDIPPTVPKTRAASEHRERIAEIRTRYISKFRNDNNKFEEAVNEYEQLFISGDYARMGGQTLNECEAILLAVDSNRCFTAVERLATRADTNYETRRAALLRLQMPRWLASTPGKIKGLCLNLVVDDLADAPETEVRRGFFAVAAELLAKENIWQIMSDAERKKVGPLSARFDLRPMATVPALADRCHEAGLLATGEYVAWLRRQLKNTLVSVGLRLKCLENLAATKALETEELDSLTQQLDDSLSALVTYRLAYYEKVGSAMSIEARREVVQMAKKRYGLSDGSAGRLARYYDLK